MAENLASNFQKKLNDLNPSSISVQSLSKWMLFNYRAAAPLVKTWTKEFLRTKPERKLVFLFLANDVLQQSRKKGRDYLDEWGKALPSCYSNLHKTSGHLQKPMDEAARLCNIWQERSMYDAGFLDRLRKALAGEHASGGGAVGEGSSTGHHARRPEHNPASSLSGPAGKLAEALVKIDGFKRDLSNVGNQIAALPVDIFNGGGPHTTHETIGSAKQMLSLEGNLMEEYKAELKGSMLIMKTLLNEQVSSFKEIEEKIVLNKQKHSAVDAVKETLGPNTNLQFQAQGGAKPPQLVDSDDEDAEPNAKRQKLDDEGEDYEP